jgi:Mrp family chromosome partitioning ATPase
VARSVDRPQHLADRPQNAGAATNTTEKRPLSSFIAGAGIGRLSHDAPEVSSFRAGTTIASFQWPSACRALAQRCASQLDGVADTLIAHAEAGRSLVGVVGLSARGGATTIAACLAARLASRGQRIIVVDGNFARPGLASLLEAESTAGWQDVLKHGAPLADAVVRATDDGFDILALGSKRAGDPLRLVSGLQAVVTAGVLRHAYDLVLIDAGSISDAAQQSIVLALVRNLGVDAALAIAGPAPADPRDLATLADCLSRTGCELLGTIENRIATTHAA